MKQALSVNSTISHYRVLSRLGAGGMGEVYLAEDLNLRRKVALKVLSAEYTQNDQRLRRFEQEAYAASALSHPNILVVYEIGSEGGTHFIAAEFIEGLTLRQRMARERPGIGEVLNIAGQVATALVAAHKAGIVHRDIKPENIMIREDGYVKLLDFGLAKLIEQPLVEPTGREETAGVDTQAGTVMGTVSYMSPEQVRGKEMDARTDVFSVGIVIYEMVTGQRPFAGESSGDVMAAILTREPAPLVRYQLDTPSELERIVRKALRKDREERYQTSRELLIDLKTLRQELEIDERISRLSESGIGPRAPMESGAVPGAPAAAGAKAPGHLPAAVTGLTGDEAMAEPRRPTPATVAGRIRRHKLGVPLAGVALVAALFGGAYVLHKVLHRGPPPASPAAMRTILLTNTGKAQLAAMSPDGQYVAYVQGEATDQSLWMRQVSTAGNVQVIPSAQAQYWGLAFSPEGNFIYYVRAEKDTPRTGVLFQAATLGSDSRKLLEDVSSPISVSPDGRRLAFMRALGERGEMHLMVANSDGSGERKLATLRAAGFLPEHGPAWSPDGLRIAFADARTDAGGAYSLLTEIPVEAGPKKVLSSLKLYHPQQLAWLSDSSGLLFIGQERPTAFAPQIWRVSYPGGEARRLTQQLDNYSSLSLNRDSTAMAAVQWRALSTIWFTPVGGPAAATQVQSQIGAINGKYGLAWMPDGRIAYTSNVSGNWVILASNADGSDQKQLTLEAFGDYDPAVTPDGRYLVFASNRGGGRGIWRMDLGGGNLKQLTQGSQDWMPHCSPDGKWIVFASLAGGKRTIWKAPIDGGPPVQLTDRFSNQPVFSADGKSVACFYSDERPGSHLRIAIIPAAGGPPMTLLDPPATAETLITNIRWMPDGRGIAYVDTQAGVSNIWSQPLDGGPPGKLTHFTSERILKFDISPDGKRIACARGGNSSDVVLISDFR